MSDVAEKRSEIQLPPGTTVSLTEKAIQKVREFQAQDPQNRGKNFRVYVEGGGCGGFQYGFMFDDERDGDHVVGYGDVKVLVDPKTALYMSKSVVDYQSDMMGSGFVVTNPQAKGGCGCGKSFNV